MEVNTGKVIESDLNHSHPGKKEPYGILMKIGQVDMDGAAGDRAMEQRLTNITTTKEYTIYKS